MPRKTATERADVYTRITAEIVQAVEAGAGDWRMPWHHDGTAIARPQNLASGRGYRGVNVLALWAAAQAAGHANGLWGTYRQWQAAGAQVRRGERGTAVVLWKEARQDAMDAADEDARDRGRVFARAFTVFNVGQVDGYAAEPIAPLPEAERIPHADAFFENLGIPTTYGPYDAHYRIDQDHIYMPPFGAFTDAVAAIGTLCHEAAHATGSPDRLDRDFTARGGADWRAMEELCAELTAAFVLADLGIAHHPRPDHAAYIASWLELLANEPRAVFAAASKAQQAADWMHAQQPTARERAS
jgi:antirestriction protein ArdC